MEEATQMAKAKKKKGGGIVSTNPDTFVSAGLADDVSGVISLARYEPWDYGGKADQYGWFMAARIELEPDEDSEVEDLVVSHYKATSNLDDFVPGDEDGDPVDIDEWEPEGDGSSREGYSNIEDVQGVTCVKIGKKEAMAKNSNWAFWLQQLAAAGFEKHRKFTGNLATDLEGLHVHMNRLPQPERRGLEGDKKRDILVVTEIYGVEETGGTGGKKAKASKKSKKSRDEDEEEEEVRVVKKKAKARAAEEEAEEDEEEEEGEDEEPTTAKKKGGGGDLEDRVVEAVTELLEGKTMGRVKLTTKTIKSFKGSEKTKVMAMLGDDEWVADDDRPWEYDEDDDTMSMEEDEE
jgi:hypothetical protein